MSTTKLEWKTIKVPKPVYEKIKYLKAKTKLHMGQIVGKSVEMYEFYIRKPYRKKELAELDKASWYIYKLVVGIGAFKENPSRENFDRLMETIIQLKNRLKIDTGVLEHAVKRFYLPSRSGITKQDLIELASASKTVIANIIVKMLYEEEKYEPR